MDKRKPANRFKRFLKKSRKPLLKVLKTAVIFVLVFLIIFVPVKAAGKIAVSNFTDSVRCFFYGIKGGDGYPLNLDGISATGIDIIDGDLLVYGKNSMSVRNSRNGILLDCANEYQKPSVYTKNGRALIYSIGENSVTLFGRTEILGVIKTENDILTAAIGKKGNLAVATFDDDNKSVLDVYNRKLEKIFSWGSVSGYISGVALSDNGKMAAVTSVGVDGAEVYSKLTVLKFNEPEAVSQIEYKGSSLFSVTFSGKKIFVVGDNIRSVITDFTEHSDVSFESDTVCRADISNNGSSAITFSVMGDSSASKLVFYDKKGAERYNKSFDKEIKWISCYGNRTAVLFENEVIVYDINGNENRKTKLENSCHRAELDGRQVYLFNSDEIDRE